VSTGHDDLDTWKRRRTITLAFELADSGRYENFGDVAYALQFEHGLATAQALIDDPDMRRQLNQRCGDAREALVPEPPAPEAPDESPRTQHAAAPSWLRRAATMLSRSSAANEKPVSTADLNSAAS
jgi:hypothetical protein